MEIDQPRNLILNRSGSETTASHYVKNSYTFLVDSSFTDGQLVATIPLDNNIDATASKLANSYLKYSIADCSLTVQSASPQGVSSGAVQVAYFPDPYNASFTSTTGDSSANVEKAVRQSGSFIARPRDSTTANYDIDGELYTYPSTDLRFSSFGAICVVVRMKPALGDTIVFNVTLAATYRYHTLASHVTNASTLVAHIKVTKGVRGIILSSEHLPPLPIDVTFHRPLKLPLEVTKGNNKYRTTSILQRLTATYLGEHHADLTSRLANVSAVLLDFEPFTVSASVNYSIGQLQL